MQRGGLLEPIAEKQCELTDLGRKWLADIAGGYPVKLGHREGVAHLCLDWTERLSGCASSSVDSWDWRSNWQPASGLEPG